MKLQGQPDTGDDPAVEECSRPDCMNCRLQAKYRGGGGVTALRTAAALHARCSQARSLTTLVGNTHPSRPESSVVSAHRAQEFRMGADRLSTWSPGFTQDQMCANCHFQRSESGRTTPVTDRAIGWQLCQSGVPESGIRIVSAGRAHHLGFYETACSRGQFGSGGPD